MNDKDGYLKIIIGPMFSGKTSQLLKLYKESKMSYKESLLINHMADDRYHANNDAVVSHDQISMDCISLSNLYDLNSNLYKNSTHIFINEAQFFLDLYDWVIKAINKDKKYIVLCGLDGDYLRCPFGKILDLIPHCDEVHKLKAICLNCKIGKVAPFTRRLSGEEVQCVIGTENYTPLCRKCYNSYIV